MKNLSLFHSLSFCKEYERPPADFERHEVFSVIDTLICSFEYPASFRYSEFPHCHRRKPYLQP